MPYNNRKKATQINADPSHPNSEDNLKLCRELMPGGIKSGSEYHSNSLRGGAGDKCRVNLKTGRWSYIPKGEREKGFIQTDKKYWKFGNDILQLISESFCISKTDIEAYLIGFMNRRKTIQ